LLSVGVLLLVAAVMPANRRRWPLAMAVGVGLHLVRDVATGPGVLLVWPISDREFVAPYSAYLLLCLALAVIATLRVIGAWRTDAETGDRRGGCH
jgi:inner membrane protein